MKINIRLLLCMLCLGTMVSAFTRQQPKEVATCKRKQLRKKRSLADYFNLNARAEVVESEVVETELPESIDDLPSVAPEAQEDQEEVSEDVTDEHIILPPTTDDSTQDLEAADEFDAPAEQDRAFQDGDEEDEVDVLPEDPTIHRRIQSPVDTQAEAYLEDISIDVQKKKDMAINLINQAVDYFSNHAPEDAFNKFSHTKDFVKAELYVFAYSQDGVCVAHPHNPELLWENLYDMRDSYGRHPVKSMIDKADQGGGWVTYEWEGATKFTYVKEVSKGDKKYVLGAGFYSHSKRDSVINLVKSAVAFFNSIIKRGFQPSIAFSSFSYPLGNFIQGDLYTYTIGFDGTTMAHGDNPGLIGSNALDVRDAQGIYINKEIIEKLKKSSDGIWIEYTSKRAPKKVYAEEVQDAEGNKYFIACGYYPDADRKEAVDLVRKAYNYMKANGKSIAAREFTDTKNNDFRYGDLYVFVYSSNGVCIAHGNNPALVGKDRIDLQDSDGRYYVREFMTKAKEGAGWLNYKVNKLFRSVYVELIDMGVDQYVIGSGLYPISKRETMVLMVKGAASYLESAKTTDALREFVKQDSKFKRGDLNIFVFDNSGICLAYGDEYDLIWRNLIKVKDDNESPFIRQMIDTVKHGPGLVKYKLNGSEKVSYVESVHKNGKDYIVGSGYYL